MAVKVLAPGYYASQDIRTPVRIAVVVLVITQLFNLALVPWLAHAGLALSIGLAALVNAAWLWRGLHQRGAYRPAPGWGRFCVQVLLATAVLTLWLIWAERHWDWTALRAVPWMRVGLMAGILGTSVLLYFGSLRLAGVNLRSLWRR